MPWEEGLSLLRTVLVDEADDLFCQGLSAAWLAQFRDVEGLQVSIFNCYFDVRSCHQHPSCMKIKNVRASFVSSGYSYGGRLSSVRAGDMIAVHCVFVMIFLFKVHQRSSGVLKFQFSNTPLPLTPCFGDK